MDFWVEDLNWRKFGSQQGTDDWDLYREKYGQYFSRGVPVDWDSGPLQDLSSSRHSDSHFRIKKSLDADEWQYIMQILSRIDVSQIEHMELELPHGPAENDTSVREAVGMDSFRQVLGSGRFSQLKTLRIRETFIMKSGYRVDIFLGNTGSEYLAEALEFGQFTNLLTLSLPHCDVKAILGALKAGHISQLRSFSIRIDRFSDLVPSSSQRGYMQLNLSQSLWEVFEIGCFKSLEHLDFSGGIFRNVHSWDIFLRAIEAGKVSNLTSLSLSNNSGCKLADLVRFLLSTPLENLIMDGCQINSLEVERFTEAIIMNLDSQSALALKRLDLHNNYLDDRAVPALERLAYSYKLAQLQDLDLSGNSGITSRALITLMETIQRAQHPSFKLLIRARDLRFDSLAAQAIVRLDDDNDGLGAEWYHVIYRSPMVTEYIGQADTRVTQYSVQKLCLNDMKEDKVDWNWDLPHCLPVRGSGARSKMGHQSGTILESSGISTVDALRLRITSQRSEDPAVWGQSQEGSARLAAALVTGKFTSLLTRSLPPGGVSFLTLSLSACDVSAILGAWTEPGLDDFSWSSTLHGLLDAALKGEYFKSLQHLELSNGALDGLDGWENFTRAINSGKLPNIVSLRLSDNALNRINLEDLVPLFLSNSLVSLVMNGCWINSEQVCALADALVLNGPATGLELKWLDLHNNELGSRAVDALVNLAESCLLPQLLTLNLGMNVGVDLTDFRRLMETIQRGRLPILENLIWVGNPVDDVAAGAIVQAYYENEDLTTTFDIDWNQVSNPALKTMMNEYRARNIGLRNNYVGNSYSDVSM